MKGQQIVDKPGHGRDQTRHIERNTNRGRTAR